MIVAEGRVRRRRRRPAIQLQWGRNLIVAEGWDRIAAARKMLELQWGRNLIVAEGAMPKPLT